MQHRRNTKMNIGCPRRPAVSRGAGDGRVHLAQQGQESGLVQVHGVTTAPRAAEICRPAVSPTDATTSAWVTTPGSRLPWVLPPAGARGSRRRAPGLFARSPMRLQPAPDGAGAGPPWFRESGSRVKPPAISTNRRHRPERGRRAGTMAGVAVDEPTPGTSVRQLPPLLFGDGQAGVARRRGFERLPSQAHPVVPLIRTGAEHRTWSPARRPGAACFSSPAGREGPNQSSSGAGTSPEVPGVDRVFPTEGFLVSRGSVRSLRGDWSGHFVDWSRDR